jgi:ABC-type ATPase with predicted acetyltransferase domain
MTTYAISKQFPWNGPLSDKAVQVCRMFGLTADRLDEQAPIHECRLEVDPGDIVYITGPSGSGKSVLLRELQQRTNSRESVDLDTIPLPGDRSVIDCFEGTIMTGLQMLGLVALSDVFSVLNKPSLLSEGQKYRFRLAKAFTLGKRFVFADEFCSALDDVTAATVAFNVHKLAKQTGTTFIGASSRKDVVVDLAPDVLVLKDLSGPTDVIYKAARRSG